MPYKNTWKTKQKVSHFTNIYTHILIYIYIYIDGKLNGNFLMDDTDFLYGTVVALF